MMLQTWILFQGEQEAPNEETELKGCCHHEYWMLDMELLGLVLFGLLCFGLIFLLLSFGMAMFTLYHFMLEVWKSHSFVFFFFLCFPEACSKDTAFNLTRSFGLLNNVENVKTTWTFVVRLTAFCTVRWSWDGSYSLSAKASHRLMCSNTWSQPVVLFWENGEPLRDGASLKESSGEGIGVL